MNSTYSDVIKQLLIKYSTAFESVGIKQVSNKSGYDTILISSEATEYRPKVEGALFCRIKENGSKPYASFRNSYKYWFDQKGISSWSIKSDVDYFRVSLFDFWNIINTEQDDFAQLAAQICIDSMSFPRFGCCSKYKQCSDSGKCIHDDQLYSSACEYRRNLEAGKIFYQNR